MTERKAQTSADYNAAMDKLRDEMALSKDQALGAIGEIMTALLQAAPEWAGAILTKGKTLLGAYRALEEYARKNRGGKTCVYVPPDTAQEVICGYYGIKVEGDEGETTSSDPAGHPPTGLPAPSRGNLSTGQISEGSTPLKGKALEGGGAEAAQEPDPFDLDALLGGI